VQHLLASVQPVPGHLPRRRLLERLRLALRQRSLAHFRSLLFPTQNHVVQQKFKQLVRAPKEQGHHQHEAKYHQGNLRRFLPRRPDDFLGLADGLLGEIQEIATGGRGPQKQESNN